LEIKITAPIRGPLDLVVGSVTFARLNLLLVCAGQPNQHCCLRGSSKTTAYFNKYLKMFANSCEFAGISNGVTVAAA
jgi:hypothetical protein